jgi:hypothetical protein
MGKLFDCKVPGCNGEVDANNLTPLQVGGFTTKAGEPLYRDADGKAVKR